MPDLWYKTFFRFITAFYFARIDLIRPENLPEQGPVLYLGLHRNGAVDGIVYHKVLHGPEFMISTQLLKNWFSRLFFHGIAVTRTKDKEGDRHLNDDALRQCLDLLRGGGRLFIFPEGTSSLGPRHLPFKSGAVWLLNEYLASGAPPIQVIPVGIHYECPWSFRSKVEVVIGARISTDLPDGAGQIERMRTLKHRIQAALEEVGVNVISTESQEMIQRIAYVATLGTPRSWFKSLKALEHAVPAEILAAWTTLEPEFQSRKLLTCQGIPLFPMGSVARDALLLILLGPVVLAAITVNLPPFLGGWFAGRKFPDDRNVISLWKIMAGVPLFLLWAGTIALVLLFTGNLPLLAAYAMLTVAGLKLYDRAEKLAVAVHNSLRYPRLRARLLDFREVVLRSLPDEAA
jgi:1-acyl-sn-glycerol-3-phosphate acyltransferase